MDIVVIGAGGHAKVVWDTIGALGHRVVAFLDENPTANALLGVPIVAHTEALPTHEAAIVAIGHNPTRQRLYEELQANGVRLFTAIHPQAIVSPHAEIGPGSLVMPGAIVNIHAMVGANAIVNTGARIDHDCRIGDHVHVAPGSVLGGAVEVDAGAFVGIGTTILPGKRIGAGATTGGGSVVTRDVPAGVTVVGIPAKPLHKP